MSAPIYTHIILVRDILEVVGAESLVGDRAHELVYQDENIFLLFNEATGKTWAAVPIWNEEQQERTWETVLDLSSYEALPEKLLTQLTPDTLDKPWPQYLEELRQQYSAVYPPSYFVTPEWCSSRFHQERPEHQSSYLRRIGLMITHQEERFMRQWLNRWNLDLGQWLSELEALKASGDQSAATSIQMFRQVLLMPEEVKAALLAASWDESVWSQATLTHPTNAVPILPGGVA